MNLNSIELNVKQEISQRDSQIDQLLYLMGGVSRNENYRLHFTIMLNNVIGISSLCCRTFCRLRSSFMATHQRGSH